MKIIQVIPTLNLGGAQTMCETLTYELLKEGHQVIIISLYTEKTVISERMERSGCKILYLDKRLGVDLMLIRKLKRIFKEEHPDVIHMHLSSILYATLAAVGLKIKRKIYTVHSVAEKEHKKSARRVYKLFFRYFNVQPIALSKNIQNTISKEYKIKNEKIPIISNGINLQKCIVKNNYNIDKNFYILHIGSFIEVKNHMGLLKGFYRFNKTYRNSKLILVGEGEKKEEIKKFVEENSLENCVSFLGAQENVYKLLNEADIFVLPSLYEGIPMTIIEAMGTGLPIVATAVGGVPDMLKNDENALLIKSNDIKALANSFEKLYNNKDLRIRLGKKAIIDSKTFSSKIMAKKYLDVYKNKDVGVR